MTDIPIVVTASGFQPQSPASIRAQILAAAAVLSPGYTANLPSSLIEDISSTDVASIALCDSALVDLGNSLTPYGANDFLLTQLGQIYGVQVGAATNTSVSVVFSGSIGFPIAQGFTVSDGTYQYIVQDGGIIGAGGSSLPLFCVATTAGSWAVPAGTVNQLISSVPTTITLTCVNPTSGVPASMAETSASYRGRVLQAGLAAAQGFASFLKTLLGNVPGVQPRLVSPRQAPNNTGWEIIVGGGDPYQVAYAIYRALFDITALVGSQLLVAGITNANPGVVTTTLDHGYATGQAILIQGVIGMTAVNNVPLTATVLTPTTFSINLNTLGLPAYISGGVVTPNLRNVSVTIIDYPDTYIIPFVSPPQQLVNISLLWNTSSPNIVSDPAIAALGVPALVDYINGISVGQPIILYQMQTVFQEAIASILSSSLLTRMAFTVSINDVSTPPISGTGIIAGDPESYFFTTSALVSVMQG